MSVAQKLGLHVSLQLQNLGVHVRGPLPVGVEGKFAELSGVFQAYDAAVAAISKDPHLSAEGKGAKQREAYDKALASTQEWAHSRTQGMSAQLDQQRATLLASDPTPTPTAMQVQHMVQHLQHLDAHEIAVFYADATDAERRLMEEAAAAIGRQPRKVGDKLFWEAPLPDDQVARSAERRAAEANPAAAVALSNSEHILGSYTQVASAALGLLRETLPFYANR